MREESSVFSVIFWVGGLYRYELRSLRGHGIAGDPLSHGRRGAAQRRRAKRGSQAHVGLSLSLPAGMILACFTWNMRVGKRGGCGWGSRHALGCLACVLLRRTRARLASAGRGMT
nr:MAG TPA: hypothetical protein [Caudoviricetes sp.]